MNGLEEIQESIKRFTCEKEQVQKQIIQLEQKRTQLAQERNQKKQDNINDLQVNELGKQISELGNQSQELQNKLDFNQHEVKNQINTAIDNQVAEGIRKVRKMNEEIQDLEQKIANQKEREAKYQLQKQEFYVRFGRMPELSETAKKENKLQEEANKESQLEIQKMVGQIEEIQNQITLLARTKKEIKNGNWNIVKDIENQTKDIQVETITIDEIEPIEEIYVEDFGTVEELYVEPFELIEEIKIEEMPCEEIEIEEKIQKIQDIEKVDEIEELAKMIVEEIAEQQAISNNVNQMEEHEEEDIIVFEVEPEKKEKVIIPLFGQKATISNIIIKIEDKQLIYKAKMSDEEEIKICPSKIGTENVLLRDKQNREECKEILINYAINENKIFDKKVINKIDPLVCELLIECAEKYAFDAQELIYNYAMSFSETIEIETENVPGIIYNLSYIEQSELTRKEKAIIRKICRNTRKNNGIDIIESFTGFRKIKYILKRLFAVNNVNVLPESKYL